MRSVSAALMRLGVDLRRSFGASLVCSSGARYLDLFTNISSLPLGYNHPALVSLSLDEGFQRLAIHRQALNLFPPEEHLSHLQTLYPRIAPFAEPHLHLTSSGSEAVETAVKLCSRKLMRGRHGKRSFVMSLEGGFHGRTCGSLSLSRTDPFHVAGFPKIESLALPFPRGKDDEDRCLSYARDTIRSRAATCSGVFVEPIQCEGGDRIASPYFFRELHHACIRAGVPFVVDEVQTGLGTGRVWAHQSWGLKRPPDAVIFSKKFQVSGVFASSSLAPRTRELYGYNSTWAGDAMRGETLRVILDVIDRDDLLAESARQGESFFSELANMRKVIRTRNAGFMGSFDVEYRDSIVALLEERGLLVGPSGPSSIRIRPPLTLSGNEVSRALDILHGVLA